MITIKCGSCEMMYNLLEKNVVAGDSSIKCPNCGIRIPTLLCGEIGNLARALTDPQNGNWKVYITPTPEKSKEIKVEDSVT